MLLGDWNCVTRPQDVEEDQDLNLGVRRTEYSKKKSAELTHLVRDWGYEDAHVMKHDQIDFTWFR